MRRNRERITRHRLHQEGTSRHWSNAAQISKKKTIWPTHQHGVKIGGSAILWHPPSSYLGWILELHRHLLKLELYFHRSQSHALCFVNPRHSLKLLSCIAISIVFEIIDHTCNSLCKISPCDLQCRILFGVLNHLSHLFSTSHDFLILFYYILFMCNPQGSLTTSSPVLTSRRSSSGKSWAVRGSEASIQIRLEWQGQQAAGGSQRWLKWVEVKKLLDKGYKIDGIGVDNFDRYVTHTVNYCYILLYIYVYFTACFDYLQYAILHQVPLHSICCCTPILHHIAWYCITFHDIALHSMTLFHST